MKLSVLLAAVGCLVAAIAGCGGGGTSNSSPLSQYSVKVQWSNPTVGGTFPSPVPAVITTNPQTQATDISAKLIQVAQPGIHQISQAGWTDATVLYYPSEVGPPLAMDYSGQIVSDGAFTPAFTLWLGGAVSQLQSANGSASKVFLNVIAG
jgi:hypothetical protein